MKKKIKKTLYFFSIISWVVLNVQQNIYENICVYRIRAKQPVLQSLGRERKFLPPRGIPAQRPGELEMGLGSSGGCACRGSMCGGHEALRGNIPPEGEVGVRRSGPRTTCWCCSRGSGQLGALHSQQPPPWTYEGRGWAIKSRDVRTIHCLCVALLRGPSTHGAL